MPQAFNHSFFTIARQGRHAWHDYLKGWLTILGMTIGMELVAIVLLSVSTEFSLDTADQLMPYLMARPLQFAVFVGLVILGLLAGLFVATERVHQRRFWTLLSPRPRVNWLRIGQGFGVWFGIYAGVIALSYLLNPARYDVTFVASKWIPWAIAVSLGWPIAMLTVVLLVYGYLLQGLSLLIRRPVWLLTLWSLLFGAISVLDTPQQWFVMLLQAAFFSLVIYQDDGLELLLGLMIANVWLHTLLLGPSEALVTEPALLQSPTVLSLNSFSPPIVNLLLIAIESGLFYVICFRNRKLGAGDLSA